MSPEVESKSHGSYVAWLIVPVIAVALWLGLRWSRTSLNDDVMAPVEVEPFMLRPLIDATKVVTLNDLQGKVTVVNFWATWCGPCVAEFPEFVALAKTYADRDDFRFLSVATGHPTFDQLEVATEQFLNEHHWKLPIYADADGMARAALSGPAPLDVIPVTLLIDREARVVRIVVGYDPAKFDELKLQIATLLRE